MRCPSCGSTDTRVIDSRLTRDAVRRRRECQACEARFTTFERAERRQVWVRKKEGGREPFAREKVLAGIAHACRKRPLGEDDLDEVVSEVERRLADRKEAEVPSALVGETVMAVLREVDEVAYVRFASVYRRFESVDQFVEAVAPFRSDDAEDAGDEGSG